MDRPDVAARRTTLPRLLPNRRQAPSVVLAGRRMSEQPRTVADMRRIIDNAEAICAEAGWEPKDTPWYIGLLSREPVSEEALERGRWLAKEHGW